MDPSMFGSLGGGGMLQSILSRINPAATPGAPAVPSDGAMQPTIGPGAPAPGPAATPYVPQLGLPKGGLLGIMQGGKANGIMGLLQNKFPGLMGGGPLAGGMPPAGMLGGPGQFPVPAPNGSATPAPGLPGSVYEGPVAPPNPDLPMNITRDNQF